MRQLLCSNQDSTIILDGNNYAYVRNVQNNESTFNNTNKSIMLSNKKSKSNKKIECINNDINIDNDIVMENKISNNNINERRYDTNMADSIYMNNNTKNNNNENNKSIKLNYSSKKNFNDNYMDNLFDSFNDISKIENQTNNNINYYNAQQNQKIIPIKLTQNESKMTQMSSYQNYNLLKSTYNNNNNLNYQKDNGSTNVFNNKKYLAYSEKKKENVNNGENRVLGNKTEFKMNNLYSDISTILLNDSLHIPNI